MSKLSKRDREFIAGYAVAVAGLARDHMEPDLAGFLLKDSGFVLSQFETCGLDDYDLNVIRETFKTLKDSSHD